MELGSSRRVGREFRECENGIWIDDSFAPKENIKQRLMASSSKISVAMDVCRNNRLCRSCRFQIGLYSPVELISVCKQSGSREQVFQHNREKQNPAKRASLRPKRRKGVSLQQEHNQARSKTAQSENGKSTLSFLRTR